MAIATNLLEAVLSVAAENSAFTVDEVELEAGVMKLIVPEALELAWSVVTEGTAAQGALLKVTEVPMRARCRKCGLEFEPKIDNFLCSGCGQADVEIVAGDDIILKGVICRSDQGASAQ
jgi:hydrogenase nickel incorporation protein HypA/HybF